MPRASKTGVRGLYRDGDGLYRIDLRWRDADTGALRRHRERLPKHTTAVAAKERARRILVAAMAGEFKPDEEPPKRLSALVDRYLEWAEANRPGSVSARRSHAKVIKKHLGDPMLDDLDPLSIERMKRAYRAGGRAPASVNRVLATLKHAVRLASDWGWIQPSTAQRLRSVKLFKEPPGRVRFLAPQERSSLLEVVPGDLHGVVLTALLRGLRLGEVLALRPENIDLSRRQLLVANSKNGRARRIPINDILAPVLKGAVTQAQEAEAQWLFTNSKGKKHRADSVSRRFNRAVEKASLDDFRFHDLRHDFATRVRGKNVGLDVIAKLLGHQSLAMAQRYAHVHDAALVEAVAGLGA